VTTALPEGFARWGRRLRSYFLAFIPPPKGSEITKEVLKLDAAGVVHMFQHERHALFGRNIEISTPRIDMIAYRDSAETTLRIARTRNVTWVDAAGRREPWRTIWVSGARLLLDTVLVPLILRRHLKQLEILVRRGAIRNRRGTVLDCAIYLRLDIVFGLVAGGAVAHTVGIVEALRKRLGALTFVCFEPLPGLPAEVPVSLVPLRYGFGRNSPVAGFEALVYNAPMLKRLGQLSRANLPAFIYQRFCQGQYAGAWFARQRDIPLILEYNGSELWISRHWGEGIGRATIVGEDLLQRIEDANLTTASLIVVVSDVLRDQLVTRGYDAARIVVVPNAVNSNEVGPHLKDPKRRVHLGLPLDVPVIGFIGTLGLWHGVEILIDAFDRLLRQNPDIAARDPRLLVIGDGDRMPMIRAEVAKRDLGSRVKLAGLTPQTEGVQFLASSDILVSPHVPNPDGSPFFGSPTKIFEYMALQRPIVASRLGQLGSVLDHGRTALLTEPGNADDVAGALATLLRHPELAEKLALAARCEAVERHSWDQRVETILAALAAQQTA
jgi:glycosyltransferase involved in cell wall biosynthesis